MVQQPARGGQTSKIYDWLAAREQRAVDAGGLGWSVEAGAWGGDPVRLARFRRAEAVDIPALGLPAWAWFDRSASQWSRHVVVHPNGDLVFRDDVAVWVAENCGGA